MPFHTSINSASNSEAPVPNAIIVHQQSRVLEIGYQDSAAFHLPFEFLRVYSPSAEVQGHTPGQEILQTGKRHVLIASLEPVGNYGVKPDFSDGHNTGIFTWQYLYWLGTNQDMLWQDYLSRLVTAGHTVESGRDAPMPAPTESGSTCGV